MIIGYKNNLYQFSKAKVRLLLAINKLFALVQQNKVTTIGYQ